MGLCFTIYLKIHKTKWMPLSLHVLYLFPALFSSVAYAAILHIFIVYVYFIATASYHYKFHEHKLFEGFAQLWIFSSASHIIGMQ